MKNYEGIAELFGSRVSRFKKDGCRSGWVGMNCSFMDLKWNRLWVQCHDCDMGVVTLNVKPLN